MVPEIRYFKGKQKGIMFAKQANMKTAAFKFIDPNPINDNEIIITPWRFLHKNRRAINDF